MFGANIESYGGVGSHAATAPAMAAADDHIEIGVPTAELSISPTGTAVTCTHCRAAVVEGSLVGERAVEKRMARGKPGEARRVISCELNADGKDYIGPAVAQAQGLPTQTTGQADLFGGGK